MKRNPSGAADDAIASEAMDWFQRNREGVLGDAERVALLDWMKRSPEHVRAYMHALALHRQIGEALQSALAEEASVPPQQAAAKVVPLFGHAQAPLRSAPHSRRTRWWGAAAAACIALL
ncbi:MAG: iron dicitrate transport regulator FecR, partial [Stenotrophomonas maltophilia]